MKGTRKQRTRKQKTKKRGGFFSFFKKNKVYPETYNPTKRNIYANMNAQSLHTLYQQKCKKHMGFLKNMTDECRKIDKEFQIKIKEENSKQGFYIDNEHIDPSKSDRENSEKKHMLQVMLPPNTKSRFKCNNINLNLIDEVKNLKEIYTDCCPRGFFGKKNTSFCRNVEKKIETNKYYNPENPIPKEEISDEDYERDREFATNPVAGYSWANPETSVRYYNDEAYEQESMYNEKIRKEKEEEDRMILERSKNGLNESKNEEKMRFLEGEQPMPKKVYGGKTRKRKITRKKK
jgi:hypothetical protein